MELCTEKYQPAANMNNSNTNTQNYKKEENIARACIPAFYIKFSFFLTYTYLYLLFLTFVIKFVTVYNVLTVEVSLVYTKFGEGEEKKIW